MVVAEWEEFCSPGWILRSPQTMGSAAPEPCSPCSQGLSTRLDFFHSYKRRVHHRPHAHHTGYNRRGRLTNQPGSHLTQDALEHPKRNLATLNVSWIAWWGMSLLWFSVLTALETENKAKIHEILTKSMGMRFQWKAWDGAHGSIWALTVFFFQRKREYACLENHFEPMHLRYS